MQRLVREVIEVSSECPGVLLDAFYKILPIDGSSVTLKLHQAYKVTGEDGKLNNCFTITREFERDK
ncbi:MAG: hypothetical protein QM775_25705 [Pirellulales bacterium]